MTDDQYNAALDAVESLPVASFDQWALTKAEQNIIHNLPESTLDLISEKLGAYKVQSGLDIRGQIVLKAVAMLYSQARSMKSALDIGYDMGVHT